MQAVLKAQMNKTDLGILSSREISYHGLMSKNLKKGAA
jgi:hypothetical protein